jgi:hypothetical protein
MKLKLSKLVILWGDPCERQECDYYTHYLRYGPPAMSHAAYHKAVQECLCWQTRAERELDEAGKISESTIHMVTKFEQEVRA